MYLHIFSYNRDVNKLQIPVCKLHLGHFVSACKVHKYTKCPFQGCCCNMYVTLVFT